MILDTIAMHVTIQLYTYLSISTQVTLQDGHMQTFTLTVDLRFFIWHMVTMIMISSMVAMTTVTNTARTIIRVVSSSLLPVDVESSAETGPVGS